MDEESGAAAAAGTKTVDLSLDESLRVNIADATNEKDVVRFTVATKTTLDRFKKRAFKVTRQFEEFVWLHDRFVENTAYAGLLIPPCPPKPDFSASGGKLAKLQADAKSMPDAEAAKLRAEIQGEYLAAFQKTVAMHEAFLMRLSMHPVFREDQNLQVFLEFDKDLQAKAKSRKEKVGGLFSSLARSVDSSFNNFKDPDEYFDLQRSFIVHYIACTKESKQKLETKVKKRQALQLGLDKLGTTIAHSGNTMSANERLRDNMRLLGQTVGKVAIIQKKLAAKEDLKLTDILRYHEADSIAAKDLMYRRIKAYQKKDDTTKSLDTARAKQKKVAEAEAAHKTAVDIKAAIDKTARPELETFKKRRFAACRKGLIQYTQNQIRQAKEETVLWTETLAALKAGV